MGELYLAPVLAGAVPLKLGPLRRGLPRETAIIFTECVAAISSQYPLQHVTSVTMLVEELCNYTSSEDVFEITVSLR